MPTDLRAWRRDDGSPGHSVARLDRTPQGWTAHGVEVLVSEAPLACWFRVDLDPDWSTVRAEVRMLDGAGERTLLLERTGGAWTADGLPRPDLTGCVDVDVAATPLTNTFPIRRLAALPTGASRTAPVAWVDVPALGVQRVDQTYERLGERRWQYGDPQHGAFLLEVDAKGLVERYEGFAVRIG